MGRSALFVALAMSCHIPKLALYVFDDAMSRLNDCKMKNGAYLVSCHSLTL